METIERPKSIQELVASATDLDSLIAALNSTSVDLWANPDANGSFGKNSKDIAEQLPDIFDRLCVFNMEEDAFYDKSTSMKNTWMENSFPPFLISKMKEIARNMIHAERSKNDPGPKE